jgi:hypothetical protein
MARELPIIRYSLKDRGRIFGIPRDNINVRDIVDKMNGAECQERVKCRDVQGYLGHWARIKFGLRPTTGGIAEGKMHYVTPDLVTTYLKALPDGTVEHKTELLDTTGGIAASKMWDNKVGGFSSAIDLNNNTFFGFDYVPDPNFIKNSFRGVMLDSATMTDADIEEAAAQELTHAMLLIINQKDYALDQAHAALNNAIIENEELLSILSAKREQGLIFDSASAGFERPLSVAMDNASRMLHDIESFGKIPHLPQIKIHSENTKENKAYEKTLSDWRHF